MLIHVSDDALLISRAITRHQQAYPDAALDPSTSVVAFTPGGVFTVLRDSGGNDIAIYRADYSVGLRAKPITALDGLPPDLQRQLYAPRTPPVVTADDLTTLGRLTVHDVPAVIYRLRLQAEASLAAAEELDGPVPDDRVLRDFGAMARKAEVLKAKAKSDQALVAWIEAQAQVIGLTAQDVAARVTAFKEL